MEAQPFYEVWCTSDVNSFRPNNGIIDNQCRDLLDDVMSNKVSQVRVLIEVKFP
jgi:hypothetical protein